jgi:hypothetical protein
MTNFTQHAVKGKPFRAETVPVYKVQQLHLMCLHHTKLSVNNPCLHLLSTDMNYLCSKTLRSCHTRVSQ